MLPSKTIRKVPHNMDISVFNTVSAGIKKAYETAKALLDLKIETETMARINDLTIQLGDLSGKFIEAQQAHMACQERTMQLEKEVARMNAFEADKNRYAMQKVGENSYAYALKPEAAGEEPPHYICASCYADSYKSILQLSGRNYGTDALTCHRCKSSVFIPNNIKSIADDMDGFLLR